MTESSN